MTIPKQLLQIFFVLMIICHDSPANEPVSIQWKYPEWMQLRYQFEQSLISPSDSSHASFTGTLNLERLGDKTTELALQMHPEGELSTVVNMTLPLLSDGTIDQGDLQNESRSAEPIQLFCFPLPDRPIAQDTPVTHEIALFPIMSGDILSGTATFILQEIVKHDNLDCAQYHVSFHSKLHNDADQNGEDTLIFHAEMDCLFALHEGYFVSVSGAMNITPQDGDNSLWQSDFVLSLKGGGRLPEYAADQQKAMAALKKSGAHVLIAEDGKIQSVHFDYGNGEDIDFSVLTSLHDVEILNLTGTGISNEELTHLQKLLNLQVLQFNSNPISDTGLKHLRGLVSLKVLELTATKVSDAGLSHLADMQELERLSLTGTKVSDAGLRIVGNMPRIQRLWLAGTDITDEGLQYLVNLQHLTFLVLNHTNVSDEGLVYLAQIKSLQHLYYSETQITEKGFRELTRALPNLNATNRMAADETRYSINE